MLDAICSKILSQIQNEQKEDDNILLNMDIWDWSQGVALYGMWNYDQLTGDRRTRDYLLRWFDEKLSLPQVQNVNTMAPLLTLCFLYEATGRRSYLDFCLSWGRWVLDEMPKTRMGGLQHVTIDSSNEQQLWADTVFMTVLFLAKLGQVSGQEAFSSEAKKQLMLHIRFLSDPKTGLWYHGWSFLRGDHFAGAFWARGNCWFTMAAAELLEQMTLESWVRDVILDAYRLQAETLCHLQHESGLWHTLLDDPTAYLESSGSAGLAYGLLKGARLGLLDASCREAGLKAAKAVLGQIDSNGKVQNASYGTVVADNLEYYRQVPCRFTGYGQSLALMLLTEMMRWGDAFH